MVRQGEQRFTLIPFQQKSHPELSIMGSVALDKGTVRISYELNQSRDHSDMVVVWPQSKSPTPGQRRDELWKTTCMELFISSPAEKFYWEYNFSPSGDWNLYHLADYRHGLRPEPGCRPPSMANRRHPGRLQLQVVAQLPMALRQQPTLVAGITAVVEQQTGAISYWALHHGGPEADFHRRDGFQLQLEHQNPAPEP